MEANALSHREILTMGDSYGLSDRHVRGMLNSSVSGQLRVSKVLKGFNGTAEFDSGLEMKLVPPIKRSALQALKDFTSGRYRSVALEISLDGGITNDYPNLQIRYIEDKWSNPIKHFEEHYSAVTGGQVWVRQLTKPDGEIYLVPGASLESKRVLA